jgi:hypothetical protein
MFMLLATPLPEFEPGYTRARPIEAFSNYGREARSRQHPVISTTVVRLGLQMGDVTKHYGSTQL